MVNYTVYQLYYSPLSKLEHFLIKNLDQLYPYVVAYMKLKTNLQLIIYNEFLFITLVQTTLQLSHFREIFTKCLATSDRMYLESYNFLRFSLTSIGISWWRNFWDHLYHFTTRGCQSVVGWAKNEAISFKSSVWGYFRPFQKLGLTTNTAVNNLIFL